MCLRLSFVCCRLGLVVFVVCVWLLSLVLALCVAVVGVRGCCRDCVCLNAACGCC